MDMQMPVMDGLMATRAIRQLAGMADLPIVAMTANAMAGDREICLEAGMNDHIAKPIDPRLLQAKLLQWIKPDPRRTAPVHQASNDEPVAASADPLGAIEGLDLTLGLSQVGGRQSLYRSLLQQFIADQADACTRIEAEIEASHWEEAKRAAHTLKGLSAQIGALTLRETAAQLEQALQQHEASERLQALLTAVADLLGRLVRSISDGLALARQSEAEPEFEIDRWSALQARLIALLEVDDASSVQLFEDHRALARTALGQQFTLVDEAIRHYEFQRALQALRQSA